VLCMRRGVSTEVGEEPYRIDRYLTQVQLAGYLKVISGFVFGRCARPWGSVKCRGGVLICPSRTGVRTARPRTRTAPSRWTSSSTRRSSLWAFPPSPALCLVCRVAGTCERSLSSDLTSSSPPYYRP
ncbi:hypothetical protein GR268_46255, partial [Rhizobium leguminosarum]|nr:hypothetical protein [Rhizobium leguminosarum]